MTTPVDVGTKYQVTLLGRYGASGLRLTGSQAHEIELCTAADAEPMWFNVRDLAEAVMSVALFVDPDGARLIAQATLAEDLS